MDSSFLLRFFVSFFIATLLLSDFSLSSIILPFPSSLRGQPGHIVRLVALPSLCPRFLCSPLVLALSSPSTFSLSSRLSPPLPLSSAPIYKVARPNVAAPFVAVPPTHSIAEAVRSTAADARLQTTFSRPLPNQPADDDTEMTGPTIEGEISYSSEVETALDRLLSAIDHPPFTIDEEHYTALSQLPLTYPWPSITIDLRPYVPFLERHLVAHLLSGRCGPLPVDVPAHTILDSWLKLLSEAIVHGIFDLHHAAYTPPPLPVSSFLACPS